MVTVHAISRLGIETTGMDIVVDSCLISIEAKRLDNDGSGNISETTENMPVKVVHHKVPWLAEVSSSLVRRISSSIGIDLSCLVSKGGVDEELTVTECIAAMEDLLDVRVLEYIKEHNLYGYGTTGAALTEKQVVSAVMGNTSSGSNSWGKIQSPTEKPPSKSTHVVTQDPAPPGALDRTACDAFDVPLALSDSPFQGEPIICDSIITGGPVGKKVRVD